MITRTLQTAVLLMLVVLAPGGCVSRPASSTITHVVLIELIDPAVLSELKADSDRSLPSIPSVASYQSGTQLTIEGPGAGNTFHVGFVMGFDSEDDLRAYLEHPVHTALVARWMDQIGALTVYDILAE